jgi:hypothetical protein
MTSIFNGFVLDPMSDGQRGKYRPMTNQEIIRKVSKVYKMYKQIFDFYRP